ncbi:MAG: hypothetical protein HY912_03080 [Desulfomonile tiedjei]|uniref:Uncharacterized protein n=1 Tax=Desulfomonile tiedjei TaxID=2358 RepID=A0A9D6V1T4_9BACT|nr:hypothetical protein [Desulfomonile tiedjei]
MPSQNLDTRNEQKARFIEQSEARAAQLREKGLSDKDIAKDPQIKHYKARIKQVNGAIARIGFLEDQTQKLREKKEQRLAEEQAHRAAMIAGEIKKEKKKAEEKAPEPKKKGGAKAPAKGKQEPKKKGK